MRFDLLQSFDRVTTPAAALARWDAEANSLQPVGESQNFVYRFRDRAGKSNFLRLTHVSRRSREFVQAELDFVNYLAAGGADVATPVAAKSGQLVEAIESPIGEFSAVAFEAIAGDKVKWNTDAENRKILFAHGKSLGKIHRLSQAYQPPGPRRFHWYQDHLFLHPWEYFPSSEPAARAEYQQLIQFLLGCERTGDNYGLVHGDFGTNNTLRRNGAAVAFDFDDCLYHWFLFDVGVAMQAAVPLPAEFRKAYLRVMLDGYETEKSLGHDTVEQVVMFCRLATFFRYISMLRTVDLKNLTPEESVELGRRRALVASPPAWY